uniref:Uncharacterized protein n=1 Tax=viral metagenome TaxID=1070528 RepID=A0A6M3IM41_9ZZZZ
MKDEKDQNVPFRFTTWRFHVMGAIRMLTASDPLGAYEPDEIMITPDFRRENKKVGIAVYSNPDRFPPIELLQPYLRKDFQENYILMKRAIQEAIDEEMKKQENPNDTETTN